jgi:hypothetical protein
MTQYYMLGHMLFEVEKRRRELIDVYDRLKSMP